MTIKLFVGTDPRQQAADDMLALSIRQNTEEDVEITWLRHGEGVCDGWNIGRVPGKPKSGGWGTDFAAFRMMIPELMGFDGTAIYLDCDMIVLGDLRELLDLPRANAVLCTSQKLMDVMVIDCDAFFGAWKSGQWPSIEKMRPSGETLWSYRRRLAQLKLIDPSLPPEWNCRDCVPTNAKIIHFTDVATQPWRPWPEAVEYRDHPDPECLRLWQHYSPS